MALLTYIANIAVYVLCLMSNQSIFWTNNMRFLSSKNKPKRKRQRPEAEGSNSNRSPTSYTIRRRQNWLVRGLTWDRGRENRRSELPVVVPTVNTWFLPSGPRISPARPLSFRNPMQLAFFFSGLHALAKDRFLDPPSTKPMIQVVEVTFCDLRNLDAF